MTTQHPTEAPASVTETSDLRYLDPARAHIRRRGAAIHLTIDDDVTHMRVTLLRAFPLGAPDRFISVRNDKNEEIGLIADPAALDAESRAVLGEELHRRYVIPVIRRIVGVKERFETVEWQVETDRGDCRFTTRNLRESLIRPAPKRYILTDVEGNRFDVPDMTALPLPSQAHLLQHI